MNNATEDNAQITRQCVEENQRLDITAELFGMNFPMRLEPMVFTLAGTMSHEYQGGLWQFYRLSNGGFYMAPDSDTPFTVSCENGFSGSMSADALGITACLYSYSLFSLRGPSEFAEVCSEQYHLLREYLYGHAEVGSILSAID